MKLMFAPALAAVFFLPNLAPAQTDSYRGDFANYRAVAGQLGTASDVPMPEGYVRPIRRRAAYSDPGLSHRPTFTRAVADILSSDAYLRLGWKRPLSWPNSIAT